MQVRLAGGERAAIGTAIILNENLVVVSWLHVNSTSPRHMAIPILQLLIRNYREV